MPKLSANLGFLWTELSLVDAIYAAKKAGFEAVECHWPFAINSADIKAALKQTGLPMISLNTNSGDINNGDFGLCALPNRVIEAKHSIEEAIQYANEIGTKQVHVMPGKAAGMKGADSTFLDNLNYATQLAKPLGITILIEPINQSDVPNYFLANVPQALKLMHACDNDNIKILFDCYHAYLIHEEVLSLLQEYLPHIGHIQIASLPQRHEPNEGVVDYVEIFKWLDSSHYESFVGAEYKPRTTTEAGLRWMTL